MPRGFHKDAHETLRLRAAGYFKDKRSFRSHEKDGRVHDLLKGEDKEIRRLEVFHHFGGICTKCGFYANLEIGEWHHVQHKLWNRCDCLHNAEWRHHECHAPLEHPQVRWTPRAAQT